MGILAFARKVLKDVVDGEHGVSATWIDSGGSTVFNVRFAEYPNEETRNTPGARVDERRAYALLRTEDAPTRVEDTATLTIGADVWQVDTINPAAVTTRVELFIATPLDQVTTAIVGDKR